MAKNGILITVASNQEGADPQIVTPDNPLPIALYAADGSPIKSLGGAIDVHTADVHNVVINQYVHQDTAVASTLAVASLANDYTIEVADATGFIVGGFLHVNTTAIETTHSQITAIAGNVLTLDRRLDFAHSIGDDVNQVVVDMAKVGQAGTMVAPQEYYGEPPPGAVWHIARLLFSMRHGTAGDLGLFGNLTALANGVLIRVKVNGQYGTLTNWKTNADIKTDMFDVEFDNRSGGGGSYGTSGRGTFAETGAILRLDGDMGDRFEVYVQDDITALDFFAMKIQGHLEG